MKKLACPLAFSILLFQSPLGASPTAPAQDFEAETSSLSGLTDVRATAIGDVDGDGVKDVVMAGSGNTLAVWSRGLGDGTFLAARDMTPGFEFPDGRAVATADLDGDGDDDVVLAGGSSLPVGWIESLGGGAFASPVTLVNGTNAADSVSTGDLDGDSLPDILYGRNSRRAVWIRNLGGGSFAPPLLIAIASGRFSSVASADLDGDGDLDVLLSDEVRDTIEWVENLGGGTFGQAASLGLSVPQPSQVAASDLDGDGDLDLVASNNGFPRYYENVGALTFTGNGFFGDIDAVSFVLMDVDGDGLDDCVTAGDKTSRLQLNRNVGGSFAAPVELPTRHDRVSGFAAGDVDADGDMDLVSAGDAVEVHLQVAGTLAPGAPIMLPPIEIASWDLGDLDGDGLADLAIAEASGSGSYTWLRNQGGGSWSAPVTAFSLTDAAQVEAVDIDGDGDLDLVASGGSFDEARAVVAWAENLGAGAFAPSEVLYSDSADSAAEFRVGDMDGDGDLDVLWFHLSLVFANERFEWITQVAPGVFTRGPVLPDNSLSRAFELEDIDGDGDADVVLVDPFGNGPVSWRANNGAGSFGPDQLVQAPGTSGTFSAAAGDLDEDSQADIVTFGFGVQWYRGQATGGFSGPTVLEAPASAPVIGRLQDADGDGRLDVIVGRPGATARWYQNLGAGAFGPAQLIPGPAAGSIVVDVADLDGDLDLDLLKRRADGTLGWNRNAARLGEAYCGPGALNSTEQWGAMSAEGSREIAVNDLTLIAERLPSMSFGYFLVAPLDGFVAAVPGSQGSLCLGGPIGRLNRSMAEIFQTDMEGFASARLNVLDIPTPTGSMSLLPGDTRYFQAWYRDANPLPTSNFTGGLRIQFE